MFLNCIFGIFFIINVINAIPEVQLNIPNVEAEKILSVLGPHLKKCIEESGVPLEELKSHEEPYSHEKLCFMKCMSTEMGNLDSEGNVNVDGIRELLEKFEVPQDKADAVVECSKTVNKVETCEDMQKLKECKGLL